MEDGESLVRRAIRRMISRQIYFASGAFKLRLTEDRRQSTLATDGTLLKYNPDFFASLTDGQQMTAVAHEVAHCYGLHPFRRGNRDTKRYLAACDHWVNHQLQAAGFEPIPAWLCDPRYREMTVAEIYRALSDEQVQEGEEHGCGGIHDPERDPQPGEQDGDGDEQGNDSQDGDGDGNTVGGSGCGSGSAKRLGEEDWKRAAATAGSMARKANPGDDSVERAFKSAQERHDDWRAALAPYLTAPSDITWSKPNRRYIGRGVYMPGKVTDALGFVAVAVDTSGSISDAHLAALAGYLDLVWSDCEPRENIVIYCDNRVRHVEEYRLGEKLGMHGGGGTALRPVFDAIASRENAPDVLIYFSDLQSDDLPGLVDPGYPVVWLTPGEQHYYWGKPTFGEIVVMEGIE